MSDDAQRWKEKYLKSIEQQDKLERRWAARLDLLRRGLVRSTLAAEGTDKVVDQCMKEMRDVVRTDDMDAGLAALLPRLEKAVLDSEQRRETRIDQVSTALTALVTQLQALPLPREVAQPLKKFAKQLDSRVGQAREMPLLLSELSERDDADALELIAVGALLPDDLGRLSAGKDLLGVVFDRPTSPGNIGSLIRSADAFGASGLIVTGHAADVYDPKTVRASTGSLFHLPVVRVPSPTDLLDWVTAKRERGPTCGERSASRHPIPGG